MLNLTLADSVIAFYDAKYTYKLWRPITAIRAPGRSSDPDWLAEVGNTTPDPSYPGAHAVISSAAADVLADYFGSDRSNFSVTSEVLPGVERSFETFSDAAKEATASRVFAGVHFRFDLTTGAIMGDRIADFVDRRFLTPAR